ncbi:MAG: hypothetical protein AAB546_00355 [Patescibacteria group bacterium]
MSEIENHIHTDFSTRSRVVESNFYTLEADVRQYVESHPQPADLKQSIQQCASIGIWGKINSMNNSTVNTEAPIVFTGQQPTLDYGVHRRVAKRIGVHSELTIVHTHADHDRAGKSGFSYLELPIYVNGDIQYRRYDLAGNYNDNDLMSDVQKPKQEDVEVFFDSLISDCLSNYSQDSTLLCECKDFILENYQLIRSFAEFNSAVQSYLMKKLSPQSQTVDIMLSDFLKTDAAKKGLAEIILELPEWISHYNNATEDVKAIEFPDDHLLPQPLRQQQKTNGFLIFKRNTQLFELPLWVTDKNSTNKVVRERAWMKIEKGNIFIGTYDAKNNRFTTVLKYSQSSTAQDLLKQNGFDKISPAAITLVDLLRKRLSMPVIHGKTGHYYETINELTTARSYGIEIPSGSVVYPNGHLNMSPIGAISHSPKALGIEKRLLTQKIAAFEEVREQQNARLTIENKKSGEAYQLSKDAFTSCLESMGLSKVKDAGKIKEFHPLSQLASEYQQLVTFLTEQKIDIKTVTNNKKFNTIAELLYELFSMDNEQLISLLSFSGLELPALHHFWRNLQEWVGARSLLDNINQSKRIISDEIEQIDVQISNVRKRTCRDISLIEAAMTRPKRVGAIYRLERAKLDYERSRNGH